MKIKDMPASERPRERLIKYGASNLSNEDLVSIIIKTGCLGYSVRDIALIVIKRLENISELPELNMNYLKGIKGLGDVKIIELLASIELGKRVYLNSHKVNSLKYNNPYLVYQDNLPLFRGKKQEYFYCLYLDNKNRLIERKLLFMGTVNRSIVHPREIFKEAYLLSSSGLICMHNHPSGEILPSNEDIELTKSLVEIGKIQGINVLDHLIISDNAYYSFSEEGLIR